MRYHDKRITRIETTRCAYGCETCEDDEHEPDITQIGYDDLVNELDRQYVQASESPSDSPQWIYITHDEDYMRETVTEVSYHPADPKDADLIAFAWQGSKTGNWADRLPEFSSIGSYPLIYLTKNDEVLCAECASIFGLREHNGHVLWEGAAVDCEECGEVMETAYGDPDEEGEEE